jgi:hypothetical protein
VLTVELKTCTVVMINKASAKHEMMSYLKFTKALIRR